MKLSVFLRLLLTGCCCVSLVAVTAQSEIEVYRKVGDKVVLKPSSVPEIITSLTWKYDRNIAMQWDSAGIESYQQFAVRGHLNSSTGEMTITNVTLTDSEVYIVEINDQQVTPNIRLTVLSPVPVPTVNKVCNDDTSCDLTCDGNIAGAEPVTYTWKSDEDVLKNASKTYSVTKEESLSVEMFSCEMNNRVSQESSRPFPNPFKTSAQGTQSKAITGVVVFISLLTPVLLLAVVHRFKAGMWFYEKASMPWEADFWSNEKKKTRDGARGEEEKGGETLMT